MRTGNSRPNTLTTSASRPLKNLFTAESRLKHRHPASWASQPRCYDRRGAGPYLFNGRLGLSRIQEARDLGVFSRCENRMFVID